MNVIGDLKTHLCSNELIVKSYGPESIRILATCTVAHSRLISMGVTLIVSEFRGKREHAGCNGEWYATVYAGIGVNSFVRLSHRQHCTGVLERMAEEEWRVLVSTCTR